MKSLTTVVLLSSLFLGSTAQAAVDTELTSLASQVAAQQLEQFRLEIKQQLTSSIKASLTQVQLPDMLMTDESVASTLTVKAGSAKVQTAAEVLPE